MKGTETSIEKQFVMRIPKAHVILSYLLDPASARAPQKRPHLHLAHVVCISNCCSQYKISVQFWMQIVAAIKCKQLHMSSQKCAEDEEEEEEEEEEEDDEEKEEQFAKATICINDDIHEHIILYLNLIVESALVNVVDINKTYTVLPRH